MHPRLSTLRGSVLGAPAPAQIECRLLNDAPGLVSRLDKGTNTHYSNWFRVLDLRSADGKYG